MADGGTTDVADLVARIEAYDLVHVRLALVQATDTWQVRHGEAILDGATKPTDRTWRYADAVGVERPLPGPVLAGLLREETHMIDGLKVAAPASQNSATFQRVAGHTDWRPAIMPWPRTQWEINSPTSMPSMQSGLLVGIGPSFVSYEAAFSAFFLGTIPSNNAGQQPLWRIMQIDQRAWLHQAIIAADVMTVIVKGKTFDGVLLELSTPDSRIVRPVGRTGRLRVRLPKGLADSSLLLLRHGDEWLDYRYFFTPGSSQNDASVIWHQPDAGLSILVAGGEGQYVEFKQEVQCTDKSRKTVLKTIAAFASGEGGTLIFGVDDDAQVVGIDPTTLDGQMLAVTNMIRDSIEPEPPYSMRVAELNGKTLLVVEVRSGGKWHALYPAKPEFYVRRGASTPPARLHEIADGFGSYAQPW